MNRSLLMKYVNQIKDEGTRKVLTLRLLYGYSHNQVGKMIGIQPSTAEKIGRKGALKIKEMMFKDMSKQGLIFGNTRGSSQ